MTRRSFLVEINHQRQCSFGPDVKLFDGKSIYSFAARLCPRPNLVDRRTSTLLMGLTTIGQHKQKEKNKRRKLSHDDVTAKENRLSVGERE
jgi:hypothetical protein